jgi:hypothetical protein
MNHYRVFVSTFDDGCKLVWHRHPDGHVVIEKEERRHYLIDSVPRWRRTGRAAAIRGAGQ